MAKIERKGTKKKSQATFLKDSIMTGISYMIPVIVGGGVVQAIAKMMGGYDIGNHMAEVDSLAKVIFLVGSSIMGFVVPAIAGFVAYAMADKPGIAPGLAMGALANSMNTGFVGGLVGGILVGYLVIGFKKIKVPKALDGIMPIMIIPVFVTLIAGLLMWYVFGIPIQWFMGALTNMLTSLNTGSKFLLGAVIGAMITADHGGPINKTAALFSNGLNADGFLIPTSAKMCAGMTAPLGIAIATFLGGKKKFSDGEREQAKSLILLSTVYVQEGVIPFLMKDPIRVMASCMTGGAITGGLCMISALESPAVHGGMFVIPMMSNPLMFVGYWFLGATITGVLYAFLRKPLPEDYEDSEDNFISTLG
ncbi:PTS fructose transporter subunit IIC [Enterococcus casseliflavus]|uniref:PTS fructose transporter subunit IIC n=1 Tax=Enterococcus casseliflavus TaxID=37734 RepID=UPI001AD7CC17|nr:PTS fructose transporter subunit IIC [Enterococcus casseliflavus]MBO6359617.1 PTS fructose transporter subunit IIC [Enterococcus casseliflavus]MBO6377751.1 PTS fructose transporter subunit IIC [Enterococcus casseliflavus]